MPCPAREQHPDDRDTLFLRDLVESGILTEQEARDWSDERAQLADADPADPERDAYEWAAGWGRWALGVIVLLVAATVVRAGVLGPRLGIVASVALASWLVLFEGRGRDERPPARAWVSAAVVVAGLAALVAALLHFGIQGWSFWALLGAGVAVAWIASRAFEVPALVR